MEAPAVPGVCDGHSPGGGLRLANSTPLPCCSEGVHLGNHRPLFEFSKVEEAVAPTRQEQLLKDHKAQLRGEADGPHGPSRAEPSDETIPKPQPKVAGGLVWSVRTRKGTRF